MRRLAALLASTMCLLLAACGGSGGSSGADARETLRDALDELRTLEGVTVTLTVQSTPESLTALEPSLSAEAARRILDSSLRMSATNPSDPAKAASEVVVNVAGEDSIELRTLEETLYVRADVARILELSGQDPALAGMLAQRATAPEFAFVRDLVAGRWIALRGAHEAAGESAAAGAAQMRAANELLRALEEATSVTSQGEEDAGEHLVVSANLRALVAALQETAAAVPSGAALPSRADVPDRALSLDVWVADGRVSQVELDLLQLREVEGSELPEGVERLALRATVDEFTKRVEAPPDAVPVDARRLLRGMLGGMAPGLVPQPPG